MLLLLFRTTLHMYVHGMQRMKARRCCRCTAHPIDLVCTAMLELLRESSTQHAQHQLAAAQRPTTAATAAAIAHLVKCIRSLLSPFFRWFCQQVAKSAGFNAADGLQRGSDVEGAAAVEQSCCGAGQGTAGHSQNKADDQKQ
jgi:hypothetical protein